MQTKICVRKQSGFVLVLAIGAILLLSLVISTVAINVQGLISVANDVQAKEQASWNGVSARSRIMYSILTGEKTFFGFSNLVSSPRVDEMGDFIQTPHATDLRVDGRWYLMNGFPFSIQDKAGLLGANTLSKHEFGKLFSDKLDRTTSVEVLSQQYGDFLDTDNEQRFMGAEAISYSRQNRRPPLNRSIFLPEELLQLLSWPDSFMPWYSLHAEQLTWNINTAPRSVLSIKTASSVEAIDRFIKYREHNFYTGVSAAEKLLGSDTVLQGVESVTKSFSRQFRFAFMHDDICSADGEETCQITVGDLIQRGNVELEVVDFVLTPLSDDAPYAIKNSRKAPLYDFLLSAHLAFPLTQPLETSVLSSESETATIYEENETEAGYREVLPLDVLTTIEDVPVVEYKNKTISISKD